MSYLRMHSKKRIEAGAPRQVKKSPEEKLPQVLQAVTNRVQRKLLIHLARRQEEKWREVLPDIGRR